VTDIDDVAIAEEVRDRLSDRKRAYYNSVDDPAADLGFCGDRKLHPEGCADAVEDGGVAGGGGVEGIVTPRDAVAKDTDSRHGSMVDQDRNSTVVE